MSKQKTYTQSELNRKEIIDYIKDGKIFPKLVAHIHGYHSGCQFYHIGNLDEEATECFNKHYEKENYGLWTDDYTLLALDYDVSDEYPYGFGFVGIVEWFELEFEDEDRKEELLDLILDRDVDEDTLDYMFTEFTTEFTLDVSNDNLSNIILGDYIWDWCCASSEFNEAEQNYIYEFIIENFDYNNSLNIENNTTDFNLTLGEINKLKNIGGK